MGLDLLNVNISINYKVKTNHFEQVL
jgi:hypothetical protein